MYAVLDRLLTHHRAPFDHLRQRWADLFGAQYEVLRYDLTRTYFEGEARAIPKAGRAQRFVKVQLPGPDQKPSSQTFSFRLDSPK